MKAMILAAGLGTRLQPLTDKKPKALMPVVNQPIISRVIDYLKTHGVRQIVVNAHHHYQQLVDYLEGGTFGVQVEVRVEPKILGTGGGIKNTSDFWNDEPFIVINSDILTNIDLGKAYTHHKKANCLVTLILHDYEPFNQVQINADNHITEFFGESGPNRLAFTGIHIMNPKLFTYFPDDTFFDIIPIYKQWIQSGKKIGAFLSQGHDWHDIGSVKGYIDANRSLLDKKFSIGPGSRIGPTVKMKEWAVVGERNTLEKDAEIKRSILWEEVTVKKGVKVIDSIVTSSREVSEELIGEIY